MTTMDLEGSGVVSFVEFVETFGRSSWENKMKLEELVATSIAVVDPGFIGSGVEEVEAEQVPRAVFDEMKVSEKKMSSFKSVWTSRGTGAKRLVSLWQGEEDTVVSGRSAR